LRLPYRAARYFYRLVTGAARTSPAARLARMRTDAIETVIAWSLMLWRLEDGDIGLFGVRHEVYSPPLCRWLAYFGRRRTLRIFDSWRGYGQPSARDLTSPEYIRGYWPSDKLTERKSPAEIERELAAIYPEGEIGVHDGYFSDTLPGIPPATQFCLIIIDANLYSAIYEVLSYLFKNRHLAAGSVVLFNSYNLSRASPDHSARAAWADAAEAFDLRFSDEGPYQWNGRKFIVQSYTGI
jgi:hypothetical protein